MNTNGEAEPRIDEAAVHQSYAGKLCPILSLATLKVEPSRIMAVGGQSTPGEAKASPCAGPACMFFKLIGDEHGNIRAGNCSIPLFIDAITMGQHALAQGQLQLHQAQVQLQTVLSKAKVRM